MLLTHIQDIDLFKNISSENHNAIHDYLHLISPTSLFYIDSENNVLHVHHTETQAFISTPEQLNVLNKLSSLIKENISSFIDSKSTQQINTQNIQDSILQHIEELRITEEEIKNDEVEELKAEKIHLLIRSVLDAVSEYIPKGVFEYKHDNKKKFISLVVCDLFDKSKKVH